jgi:enamine deaminase RidA (YjgF/YER057c/UK114 family)
MMIPTELDLAIPRSRPSRCLPSSAIWKRTSATPRVPRARGSYSEKEKPMIERFELTPTLKGIPKIAWATAHAGLIYVSGVTGSPGGDVTQQTRQILARLDELLAKAGSSKAKVLTAQVWLTDMALFAAHNDAWNEWVDQESPPARACLLSPQLWRPGLLVEIMATAAR